LDHFLRESNQVNNRKVRFSKDVMAFLSRYRWPGNVRELQNVIQRYLTVKRIDFLKTASPESAEFYKASDVKTRPGKKASPLHDYTDSIEKSVIEDALAKYRWNKSKAAEALMISRKTLTRKMKKFGLV
ncbi:MAG: helix-turn-helix domain-containing protein, partial [Desulfomonilia bacterium]|nr:helix-turn-helix domain-containing protein [Desulfomonilia bacterium]